MTGDLNFPLKICLPEAGPYLLCFLLYLSEEVSCFLLHRVSHISLTHRRAAVKFTQSHPPAISVGSGGEPLAVVVVGGGLLSIQQGPYRLERGPQLSPLPQRPLPGLTSSGVPDIR